MVGSVKLPLNSSVGGSINYTVDVFTSSGTYNKPADLNHCYVLMVSGGAGGGSGRRGNGSTNRGGGYGFNGLIALSRFNESDLTLTSSVTVGAGGTGGTARTTDNTSGANGTAGGLTNFKYGATFQIGGGTSAGGAISVGTSFTPNIAANFSGNRIALVNAKSSYSIGNFTITDQYRGNGFPTSSTNFQSAGSPYNCTSVGGQITATNVQLNSGTLGGYYDSTNTLTGEIVGTLPEANGIQPTQFYTFGEYLHKIFDWFDPADANYNVGRGGLGGGCGNLAGTVAGGNGANALGYGAAGGGGGASTNGANSGAGGNGSQGIVIIINVLN